MAVAAPMACAELVVYTHGRVVKTVSHQVTGDRIEIQFLGGGSLTLDRALVERIEEDEIDEANVPTLVPASQQPPGRVDTPRPAADVPVASQEVLQDRPAARQAAEENRPAPVRRRHHGKRH